MNDVEHLPNKFQQFLNRPEVYHKFGELVITMNEVTGAGEHRSGRFEKKRMKLALVGLRNAARSVLKVPGWSLTGGRIAPIIEEMVALIKLFCVRCWTIWATKTPRVPCLSRCAVSYSKNCAPCWDSGSRCWHQDQVVSSLGCFKDSRWLRKTPTSTSTNGCEVPFLWVSLPVFHLEVCFQQFHHSVLVEKLIGSVI